MTERSNSELKEELHCEIHEQERLLGPIDLTDVLSERLYCEIVRVENVKMRNDMIE